MRLNDGGYEAITDKEGRFVFERVPPLDMSLSDVVGNSMAHTACFKVELGQTTKLTVGGTGRPVIGRVVIPDRALTRDRLDQGRDRLREEGPMGDPLSPGGYHSEEKSEWLEEWWNSPAREGPSLGHGRPARPPRPRRPVPLR